ncbi:MAG: glycosyltransferase family 4 protein [Alphaproteobacteria bacterium]|nr:glycosyltransferase family 4 protein [Alphaproteobacteria bacterium]
MSEFLSILAFILSLVTTKLSISFFNHKKILDIPNNRSFHSKPTPTGGGWAIIIPTITLAIISKAMTPSILIGALILISISWLNDLKHIKPSVRLIFHSIAIGIALLSLDLTGNILLPNNIPNFIDRAIIFTAWLWFINLYNFMDGADGMTASETLCLCFGVLFISLFIFMPTSIINLCLILIGSCSAFLIFNWHPAKIFLGDTGAIFIGYIVGYILLTIAKNGYIAIAIILPLYYIMDTSLVLCKRILKREKIFEAHQKQYFHRSIIKVKRTHCQTVKKVILFNILLILTGIYYTITKSYIVFILAVPATYIFMKYLAKGIKNERN